MLAAGCGHKDVARLLLEQANTGLVDRTDKVSVCLLLACLYACCLLVCMLAVRFCCLLRPLPTSSHLIYSLWFVCFLAVCDDWLGGQDGIDVGGGGGACGSGTGAGGAGRVCKCYP